MAISFDQTRSVLVDSRGELAFPRDDALIRRLAMLMEGQCAGVGAEAAAQKYGVSRSRYYQLLAACRTGGVAALAPGKTGPKRDYRRSDEVVRRVIRHRFLDPDASVAVIRQKLAQEGVKISMRSVERVIASYGLQKKTPRAEP
jgi:transposase